MSTLVFTDVKAYLDKWDISGDANKVKLTETVDTKEDSTFGFPWHTFKPGPRKVNLKMEGLEQFGTGQTTIDGRLQNKFAVGDVPIVISPDGGDFGEVAYMFNAISGQFERNLQWGELAKFTLDANNYGNGSQIPLVRGFIIEDGKTLRSASGNSATLNLGPVAAGQKVYMTVLVLSCTGTNVTFTLKSAVTDFATITSRVTSTAIGAAIAEIETPVAGPITDTFWRVFWSSAVPSFNAVVFVGIQ